MLLFLLLHACSGPAPSTERPGAPAAVEDSGVEHTTDTAPPDTAPADTGDSEDPGDTASADTNEVVAAEPTLADLWIGDAAYVADSSFSPPPELRHHAETSTVTAGGRHWMYYR
ncbi:MAG: hypothetical protein ACK4YP_23525, partial [Myxococcota bacterium]